MKNEIIKIVTDPAAFEERVDEIDGSTKFETVKHVVSKLKNALYDHPETAALCAPQVDSNLRLFVVKLSRKEDNRFKVFLNPIIVKSEGLHLSRETNPSFPDKQFIIPRRNKLHVAYQTEDGHVSSETYVGAYSEVVQQMIEMLDGITLADYGLDLDIVGGPAEFDNATDEEKAELIDLYLKNLSEQSNELATMIAEDPELNKVNKTIDFMAGLLDGTITPENPQPVDEVAEVKE